MKTILLAEDDQFIRNLLSDKLAQSDFNILTADSGEEALETLQRERVDLVLLDLVLQGMSGIEVLKSVKTSDELTHLPVIVFSNNDDPAVKAECLQHGAEDFFVKIDTDLNALVDRVNAALSC